jgi:hypothetical protein
MKPFPFCLVCITVILLSAACKSPQAGAPAATGQARSSTPAGNATEWLVAADAGYQLRKGWEPVQIDYVYKWWGLAKPGFDWQQIRRRDGKYWKDAQELPRKSIQSFLDSIVHLYPTQALLGAATHTDDYPSIAIDVAGADGQRLLLISTSNDYGGAPWNIVYNGRLYAQYDGTLVQPLAKLFTSPRAEPAATYSPGGGQVGSIIYNTAGMPPQLVYGFTGLLPIADSFSYQANASARAIEGDIEGRSSIAQLGRMVIGRIDKLNRVLLTLPEGRELACSIETLSTHDPVGVSWSFRCPISEPAEGYYRYPLRVEFGADTGQALVTEGELQGTWRPAEPGPYLPLPAEIQQALHQSKAAREVLDAHLSAFASYAAKISAEQGPLGGTFTGEVILQGETVVEGQAWPYELRTPFEIHNGQLTRWDLSQAAVEAMLLAINQQPITHRVRAAEPIAALTLWYAEATDIAPYVIPLVGFYVDPGFSITLAKCKGLPGEGQYPQKSVPVRAFSFNGWRPQFLLIGTETIASDVDFFPSRPDRGVPLVLLPPEFDAGEAQPFGRVRMNRDVYPEDSPPELTLWLNDHASTETPITPKDLEVYTRIADALPQPVDMHFTTLWTAKNLAFGISEDGQLKVVACGVSP